MARITITPPSDSSDTAEPTQSALPLDTEAPQTRQRGQKANGANLGFEAKLWAAADKMRGHMDPSEYKHVALGLIFLKYISDAFTERHAQLLGETDQGADPEDPDGYRGSNVFWVPKEARWPYLQAQAKQATIGTLIDEAMVAIERDNASLKGVLPKEPRREALAGRFKDPSDPFQIVIVRDMWLTGFDAPSLHTMYVDKPMQGHGLMQAIARVNRVFKEKPGGLVVDYLGLADQLREALVNYTANGGTGTTAIDQDEAVWLMIEKYEVCRDLFFGLDWSAWTTGTPAERLSLLPAAQEHILRQEKGKERLLKAVTELGRVFALALPHPDALRIREDVAFFQAIRIVLAKESVDGSRTADELDVAVRQLVSQAVAPTEVIDIFAAAGLARPDLSILSDEFLMDVRRLPQRNVAVELLRKLLTSEIRTRAHKNVVQARSFTEMLERSLGAYRNRAIETAQVIEELIALAKEMRAAAQRGEKLGLSVDEEAFYDALALNQSAVDVLGDDQLKTIARELVATVRGNVTIDWTVKETVRARLRVLVKRILRKYGYPPDLQAQATETVLAQAEVLSKDWVAAA